MSASSQTTVPDRWTNPSVTWVLTRYLQRAERLPGPKRVRFLRSASHAAVIGLGLAALCAGGMALMCLFCGYCYLTYPASPPEYPASMWIFFGVLSALAGSGYIFFGLVCANFHRRLKPFITELR